MTYNKVNRILAVTGLREEYAFLVETRQMNNLAHACTSAALKRGALQLDIPEARGAWRRTASRLKSGSVSAARVS